MFTDRVKRNTADGDKTVRLLCQYICPKIPCVRVQPRKEIRVELCHTYRCFLHPLRSKINTDRR